MDADFVASDEYQNCKKCKNECIESSGTLTSGSSTEKSCIKGRNCTAHEVAQELWGDPLEADKVLNQSILTHFNVAGKMLDIRVNAADFSGGEDVVLAEMERDVYGLSVLESLSESDCGVVVDVGCNIGLFSLSAFAQNPNVKIVCIEPMPHTYLYMRWNLMNNNVPIIDESDLHDPSCSKPGGVLPINAAVNSDGRPLRAFYNPQKTKIGRTENMAAADTDNLARNLDRPLQYDCPGLDLRNVLSDDDSITFWKMDCEGCEHEAAPALHSFIGRARWVSGEIHQSDVFAPSLVDGTVQVMCKQGGCCPDPETPPKPLFCRSGDGREPIS